MLPRGQLPGDGRAPHPEDAGDLAYGLPRSPQPPRAVPRVTRGERPRAAQSLPPAPRQPIAGSRLHQLRVLIHSLLHPRGFNYDRIALWGDSFAAVNPADADFRVPRRIDGRPQQSEPLRGMMALLGALFEDDVKAVYAGGGLADFQSVLDHWQVFIPHDAVIPGVLTAGDLSDAAAATYFDLENYVVVSLFPEGQVP